MNIRTTLFVTALSAFLTVSSQAAPSVSVGINPANTVPNVVANSIFADGDGIDWTAAVLGVELNQGAVYNRPEFDLVSAPSQSILDIIPDLAFDSWVEKIDNPSGGLAGGAGDLNVPTIFPDYGLSGSGHQSISATWFNSTLTDTGPGQIANISLSDDANGTWSIGVTFALSPTLYFLNNPIINGELVWDPMQGDLNFDGFVGIDDLNAVLSVWNHTVPIGSAPDPSGDGFVGINDLGYVLGNWNAGMPPRPTVPVIWPSGQVGDRDGDGFVGIADKVTPWWNQTATPGALNEGDTSGDGYVGIDDLNIWMSHWNQGSSPAANATVPEPTTVGVLIAGGVMLLRRRA